MTGFFARMGARADGTEPRLRIRRPEPFETAAPSGLPDVPVADAPPAPVLPPRRPRGREPVTGPPGSESFVHLGRPDSPTPVEAPVPDAQPKAGPVPVAEPAVPETDAAVVAGACAVAPGTRLPLAVGEPEAGLRPQPSPLPDGPSSPVAVPLSAAATPPVAEPPHPVPAAPIDLPTLLRTHVLPALAARGVVEPGETAVLAEGPVRGTDDTPAPGTVTVRPLGVRPPPAEPVRPTPARAELARRAAAPPVHVHIGEIVVTKAPSAPPPVPAPSRRAQSTDHAAYRARREAGR